MIQLKVWIQKHSRKLLTIHDTPRAIAGGVAIGLFFGFSPLFGLKTLLTIAVAWLLGWNLVAAVVALALHDLLLPVMPLIYRWEYDIGFWLLTTPHHWPRGIAHAHWFGHGFWTWNTFLTLGKPLMIGSLVIGLPCSALGFWITRAIIERHRRRKHLPPFADPETP